MHSPEADLSTVNISILINTQVILVHSDPMSLSVIHTEFGERLWCLTMKGGGVCMCVRACRWRKLICMLSLTYSRGFRGNGAYTEGKPDLPPTSYNLSITAVWWTCWSFLKSTHYILKSIELSWERLGTFWPKQIGIKRYCLGLLNLFSFLCSIHTLLVHCLKPSHVSLHERQSRSVCSLTAFWLIAFGLCFPPISVFPQHCPLIFVSRHN